MAEFVLNQDVRWPLDSRETQRNSNTVIIGSPGTGKSTLMGKNLLMMDGVSHVIIDPKGDMYKVKDELIKKGYDIVLLDLIDPLCSMSYNPLDYIRKDHVEEDIMMIANSIYENDVVSERDPYWDYASIALLNAMIGYVYYMCDKKDRHLKSVIDLINAIDFLSEESSASSRRIGDYDCSVLFEDLRRRCGRENFAYRQFLSCKLKSGITATCVLSTLKTRIAKFNAESVLKMMRYNDIDLLAPANKKTAVFITVKDCDDSLHPIAGLFIGQMMKWLYMEADKKNSGGLDVPVLFWLDDFSSYLIKGIENYIATARSRNITMFLMFQSFSQLVWRYGYNGAKIIIQCCDNLLYLGGNDSDSIEYIHGITNWNNQYIAELDRFQCVLYRRGMKTQKVKLSDFDEKSDLCVWSIPRTARTKNKRKRNSDQVDWHYERLLHSASSLRNKFVKLTKEKDKKYPMLTRSKITTTMDRNGVFLFAFIDKQGDSIMEELSRIIELEEFGSIENMLKYSKFIQGRKEGYTITIPTNNVDVLIELLLECEKKLKDQIQGQETKNKKTEKKRIPKKAEAEPINDCA